MELAELELVAGRQVEWGMVRPLCHSGLWSRTDVGMGAERRWRLTYHLRHGPLARVLHTRVWGGFEWVPDVGQVSD